jgi:hypothetical protein
MWIVGRKLACLVHGINLSLDAIDESERHSSFF